MEWVQQRDNCKYHHPHHPQEYHTTYSVPTKERKKQGKRNKLGIGKGGHFTEGTVK